MIMLRIAIFAFAICVAGCADRSPSSNDLSAESGERDANLSAERGSTETQSARLAEYEKARRCYQNMVAADHFAGKVGERTDHTTNIVLMETMNRGGLAGKTRKQVNDDLLSWAKEQRNLSTASPEAEAIIGQAAKCLSDLGPDLTG